jgi:hypothetical protein
MGWVLAPLCVLSCFALEPTEKGANGKGLTYLESLLIAESQGNPVDRSKALAPSKELSKDVIYWQSGDLALKGTWKSVLELDQDSLDTDSVRYQRLRGDAPLDIEGHRKMAKWCKSNGLASRADAHWYGVLDFDALDAEARQELGFERVGDRWFSRQEMSIAIAKSRETTAALKQWMPKVREWVLAIEGNDTKKRLKAIQQLKQVKDPRVIAALNAAIGQVSTDAAIHFIQVIRRFQTREACVALAGIAVADPSSEIGIAATDALKAYPLEFYVPDLLDLMCTEYELKNQVVTRGNGDLVLQMVQMREMRKQYQATQVDKLLTVYSSRGTSADKSSISAYAQDPRTNTHRIHIGILTTPLPISNPVAASIASEESQRHADQAKTDIDKSNESIRMFQSNIATVLRRTTGTKLDDSPKSWWDWWDSYQETYLDGVKYREEGYYEDQSSVVYSPERASVEAFSAPAEGMLDYSNYGSIKIRVPPPPPPSARQMFCCLAPGTLIQTDGGLRPVERIRVGDQVVAQDITSGELSLRPVLRTTMRDPAVTREIALTNGEKIRATLGHPWWVIGSGWVKTRDLKEGMSLRTATGFALIEKLLEAEVSVTHNLVVDDDHTLFVGRSRLLSFDACEIIPTFQRVPGVPAEVLWKE